MSVYRTIVTASHTNSNDPLKWKASIQYEVLEEAHEVKLSFLEPPKHHKFTQFIVKLENVLGGRTQKAIIQSVSSTLSLLSMQYTEAKIEILITKKK